MTVYAPVPAFAGRKRHPGALVLIVAGHAALLAAVMTVKMDLASQFNPTRTEVKLIPLPSDPPSDPPKSVQQPRDPTLERVPTLVPLPQPRPPLVDIRPLPMPLPGAGPVIEPKPGAEPKPAVPVRIGPRFATSDSRVKPPYPQQKLRSEEEAVLRLRLLIDERGRVTSVEPVGRADPIFLSAARRHLIANWRYRPATEDGRAVATSTVVTLRFELDD